MKRIKELEVANQLRMKDLKACYDYLHRENINEQVWLAYFNGRMHHYDCPDFDYSRTIWEKDYYAILATLERFGIKKFTLSQTASGTINDCMFFQKHGYRLSGITELLTGDRNLFTGEPETKPAFVFKKGGRK